MPILRNNNHSVYNPPNNSYAQLFCATRLTGQFFPKATRLGLLNMLPGPVEMNLQLVCVMSRYSCSVLPFKYKQTPSATPEIKYQNTLQRSKEKWNKTKKKILNKPTNQTKQKKIKEKHCLLYFFLLSENYCIIHLQL